MEIISLKILNYCLRTSKRKLNQAKISNKLLKPVSDTLSLLSDIIEVIYHGRNGFCKKKRNQKVLNNRAVCGGSRYLNLLRH